MSLKRNVLDLRKRKEIVLQGGGEEAIKKQAAMGKLTARERIEAILDKDSFHEYDMFVEHQSKDFDMDKKAGKWTTRKMDLRNLKKILTRWQKGLQDIAWNSLYWENHDQPRSVSRFGNDSDKYREISAKMLATCIHMMQGTPYVYQGEELDKLPV